MDGYLGTARCRARMIAARGCNPQPPRARQRCQHGRERGVPRDCSPPHREIGLPRTRSRMPDARCRPVARCGEGADRGAGCRGERRSRPDGRNRSPRTTKAKWACPRPCCRPRSDQRAPVRRRVRYPRGTRKREPPRLDSSRGGSIYWGDRCESPDPPRKTTAVRDAPSAIGSPGDPLAGIEPGPVPDSPRRKRPRSAFPDEGYGGVMASTGIVKLPGACRGGSFPR